MANRRGQGRCAACRDPKIRREIDEAFAAGLSLRTIGQRYSISSTSLFRHKKNHPNISLVTLTQPPAHVSTPSNGSSNGQGLVDETQRLVKSCWEALDLASKSGSLNQVALHHRELRGSLELLARQVAQMALQRPVIQVMDLKTTAEWIELRTLLIRLLEPFPDAWRAVSDGLMEQAS